MNIYTSPTGRAEAKGTNSDPMSLASAIKTLKKRSKQPSKHPEPINLQLKDGCYHLDSSLELKSTPPGELTVPISIKAVNPGRVRILGGRKLEKFRPVKSRKVLKRLSRKAAEHVLEADLKKAGISDFGKLRPRGMGDRAQPAHLELFFNDEPMQLARWPHGDFAHISDVPEADDQDLKAQGMVEFDKGFFLTDKTVRTWLDLDKVVAYGYWCYDWEGRYRKIRSYDPQSGRFKLIKNKENERGFKKGQRFFFLNILEELKQPGDYYVDNEKGKLYFWPPKPVKDAEIIASVIEKPLLLLDDCSNITIEGITFECCRGSAIMVRNGENNTIRNCEIRNVGNHGVIVHKGLNHRVEDCEIYNTGDGGITMRGGNRKKLLPCCHVVTNCHIHHFSQWNKCYTPAVGARGVGITVSHCCIHDAPHSGIIYQGNDIVIEYNEIYRTILETEDCGAVYTGRDYTTRDNIIRYNYFHDNGYSEDMGHSVYWDDCTSGDTAYGNVFVEPLTRTVFIGGGRDNTVENNIFINCRLAILADGRGLDPSTVWHNMIYVIMKQRLEDMDHHHPPYSVRYPELKQLDRFYNDETLGIPPEGNVIRKNICIDSEWKLIHWCTDESIFTIEDNIINSKHGLKDVRKLDFSFKIGSPADRIGFRQIPFDKIGLEKQTTSMSENEYSKNN